MKRLLIIPLAMTVLAAAAATLFFVAGPTGPAEADPHIGQSVNVVIIGGTTLDTSVPCPLVGAGSEANVMGATGGGCLPVPSPGPVGELGDFTFTPMDPPAVSTTSLAAYDTAVLNVASSAMACDTNTLTAGQQADLVSFVAAGKKLIIYDSECWPVPQRYNWLPFRFETSNPGAVGKQGTLTIVEDNLLSTLKDDPNCTGGDVHCIDVARLGPYTDAVGDMNVMTTHDANWCVDMSGTNYLNVTGPVHTYAKYPTGTDTGLIIYNGLDQNFQIYGDPDLRKIWVQELQQPFYPSNLPCGVTVVGITISPLADSNEVGENHTVTATLTDLLANPVPGILVSFEVTSGPNAGEVSDPNSGECAANNDCTSDANGQVSWTYTGSGGSGTDQIKACFIDQQSQEQCSQVATKEWTIPTTPTPPPPTPTPPPGPPGIGGTTELLVDGADGPQSAAEGSGSSAPLYAAIVGAAAALVAVMAAGGWYARRRLLR